MPEHLQHYSFEPIVNSESAILILGTLPGPESLKYHEYYKKSGNAFWRIIFALAELPLSEDYEEKCRVLLSRRLALWDVYASVEREGAADAAIRNGKVNDLPVFLAENPNVSGIIFNGKTAEKTFRQAFPELYASIPHMTAWSTSGAMARKFEDKLDNWREAMRHLGLNNQM